MKAALDRYEPFRNKDGETVEFGTGPDGSVATHKISAITGASLTLGDDSPEWVLDLHAKRLAREHDVKLRARKLLNLSDGVES